MIIGEVKQKYQIPMTLTTGGRFREEHEGYPLEVAGYELFIVFVSEDKIGIGHAESSTQIMFLAFEGLSDFSEEQVLTIIQSDLSEQITNYVTNPKFEETLINSQVKIKSLFGDKPNGIFN